MFAHLSFRVSIQAAFKLYAQSREQCDEQCSRSSSEVIVRQKENTCCMFLLVFRMLVGVINSLWPNIALIFLGEELTDKHKVSFLCSLQFFSNTLCSFCDVSTSKV